MKIITDRTLNVKLLIGFGGIILLAGITIWVLVQSLANLNERFNRMVDVNVQAIKMSPRLYRNVEQIRTKEKALLLTENQEEIEQIVYEINLIRDELKQRFNDLNRLTLSDKVQALNRQFEQAFMQYDRQLNEITTLVRAGKYKSAIQLSRKEAREAAEQTVLVAMGITEIQENQLDEASIETDRVYEQHLRMSVYMTIATVLLAFFMTWLIGRLVVGSVMKLVSVADKISKGDLDSEIDVESKDEIGQLAQTIAKMQTALRKNREDAKAIDWLKTGIARVNDMVLGIEDTDQLAQAVLSEIADYLDIKVGAFYVAESSDSSPGVLLNLMASFAYSQRKNLSNRFKLGEGLVGQAALERKQILIQNAPEDYIRVVSGLGETCPKQICVTPILFESRLCGVLEIATLQPLLPLQMEYLQQSVVVIATAFEIAQNQVRLKLQQEELRSSNEELEEQTRSLERSQEELQTQQVELEGLNNELEAQMQKIKNSEEELKAQQEELEATNLELKDKNQLLEQQKTDIEQARQNLKQQTEELALASKYKSEFLANMSHELRTPLNSLLLLARSLAENKEGNLNDDQLETAGVIYDSGNDLLNLINEILDLSKIEAGRMELRIEPVDLQELMRIMTLQFEPMAKNQGLELNVVIDEQLPQSISTDVQRLGQVIKNLIGNALKFTEQGSVSVAFMPVSETEDLSKSGLVPEQALMIAVQDTGIGIPLDKQKIIFEAFQQADSGDRRRYGGTGLGLSISKELIGLLGGEIKLESHVGEGSVFRVFIPQKLVESDAKVQTTRRHESKPSVPRTLQPKVTTPTAAKNQAQPTNQTVDDDRDNIDEKDSVLLVIEDDYRFAQILAKQSRGRGMKCLVALNGEDGLILARKYRPDGIVLDIQLPNIDGWDVLNDLKQNVDTRHIPVHIVSSEDVSNDGLRIGAIGHASKPVRKEDIDNVLQRLEQASAHASKWVLVVEDDDIMRKETVKLIGNGNVKVKEVSSGQAALDALKEQTFALIVLDLGLPDMQGLELLNRIAKEKITLPPVIVYTVRELSMDEEIALRQYADSIILKDVRSQERLIDEVALFLHRVVNELPEDKKRVIRHLHESDEQLKSRKILIVEDDMRTMFAMTKVLASHGLNPIKAENGEKALEMVKNHPDIDLILMDMMMPVMDGYETMQHIREMKQFVNLPIIALTAKAMKEDRKKCLEAGATDYLSKPVDPERLLSLIRVWLCR